MIISNKYKFVFVHIWKTGGTSIRAALEKYADFSSEEGSAEQHLKASEIKKDYFKENDWDNYFSFAVSRNPYDWVVSVYHYITQNKENSRHKEVKDMGSFREFIKKEMRKDKTSQKDFITDDDGKLLVNFVLKFENVEKDFEEVCRKIGIKEKLPHMNKSSRRDYKEYYDEETKRLVEGCFKEDLDFFGYSF